MQPRHEITRECTVSIFCQIYEDKIKQLIKGMQLEDDFASFYNISFQGREGINQWYKITVTEGFNREVRRLWEVVDVKVNRLISIIYGDISLSKGLPRGDWIELD